MIRALLFVAMLVPWSIFLSAFAVVGGWVGAPPGYFDYFQTLWSRSLLWLAGVEVEARGLERVSPQGRQIIIANHRSMFDIWVLIAVLPASVRFVAKRGLTRIPVFFHACRAIGHVFIDRSEGVAAFRTIRSAARRLGEQDMSLVLFPEGTRSEDDRLQPFKRGSFALARTSGFSLVPVALEGTGQVLSRGEWKIRPGRVEVTVGEPLSAERAAEMDTDRLSDELRRRLAGLLAGDRADDP